jgi:hypothetical protein
MCARHLPKNGNGKHTTASSDALEHLVAAFLPALMGHFETFQRYLFAGTFDRSVHLVRLDINNLFKKLSAETNCNIDLNRLAAHRSLGAESVGLLLSDSMSGWHSPEKVNKFFCCFDFKTNFFSGDDIRRLNVLWQLRHSLVHTGGTLSIADAQKLRELSAFGGKNIVFSNNFIFEVARKMHAIVLHSTSRLYEQFKKNMNLHAPKTVCSEIDDFFKVNSSVAVWLKK